jgi:hypothetical protein
MSTSDDCRHRSSCVKRRNSAFYREIVLDVWRKKHADSQKVQSVVSRKIAELRENKSKLEEAFVYQKAIDQATYNEMRAKLSADLALAKIELREAQAEEIEIETVLDYAQMVLTNASNLWKAALSEQKQRLQQVLFPEGVTYSDGNYRTAVTSLLFSGMGTMAVKKEGLVAQTVSSWNQILHSLQKIDLLRREGLFRAA